MIVQLYLTSFITINKMYLNFQLITVNQQIFAQILLRSGLFAYLTFNEFPIYLSNFDGYPDLFAWTYFSASKPSTNIAKTSWSQVFVGLQHTSTNIAKISLSRIFVGLQYTIEVIRNRIYNLFQYFLEKQVSQQQLSGISFHSPRDFIDLISVYLRHSLGSSFSSELNIMSSCSSCIICEFSTINCIIYHSISRVQKLFSTPL